MCSMLVFWDGREGQKGLLLIASSPSVCLSVWCRPHCDMTVMH